MAWHPDSVAANAAVRAWVYAVSCRERRAIILFSDDKNGQTGYGSGKSLLARMAAECLAVMRNDQKEQQRVTMISAPEFFGQIKDTYDDNAPRQAGSLFAEWLRGHFILDDLGKQYTTERGELWAQEQLFRLIDGIYIAGHGLLITSNLAPKSIKAMIGGASWSRILGMAGPDGFIDLSHVPDYRLKEGGFLK